MDVIVVLRATEFCQFLRLIAGTPEDGYAWPMQSSTLDEFDRMLQTQRARSCIITLPGQLRAIIHLGLLVFVDHDEVEDTFYLVVSITIPSRH